MTDTELKRLLATEEQTLRELRLFLRDVLNKLSRDRKFQIFTKPVDEEDVSLLNLLSYIHIHLFKGYVYSIYKQNLLLLEKCKKEKMIC